ncbi:glycosyltransferase, partial [Candidatus Aminicenantes bacterium AC-334-K16]|nr:glycosyltransferase [Candidatus Aminicenantes bacterium AC-334-K16]
YQAGVPVIIHTLHGIHYLHYRNPVLKWLMVWQERLMSRWTDNIICVSFADARLVSRYRLAERSKIVVIRNGLEWPSRVLLSPEMKREKKIKVAQLLGVDPDFYFVGTVARLHRQKGLIYFFRSFPEVKRKINQVVFLVIGGGPLERKFSRYLRQKRWEKRIFLLGERRDVADFYPVFDLFVLPSLWEGLPLALLEAAQWELPVVATDIDGCREVITSGKTGLLVAPGKVKALAEAIIWVREHPAEAQLWGQALAHEVSQRFTLREMVTQLEELYLSLVRKN